MSRMLALRSKRMLLGKAGVISRLLPIWKQGPATIAEADLHIRRAFRKND